MTSRIEKLQTKLCQDVVCNNGGTCFEGDCQCTKGFEGENCDTKLCLPNCENGGICLEGSCSCQVGFTGQFCEEKETFASCNDVKYVSFQYFTQFCGTQNLNLYATHVNSLCVMMFPHGHKSKNHTKGPIYVF